MKKNNYSGLRNILAAAVVMATGAMTGVFFNSCASGDNEGEDTTAVQDTDTVSALAVTLDAEEAAMTQMKINIAKDNPVFNEDDGTYSLKVSLASAPQGAKFHFQLVTPFDNKVVAQNDNGVFEKIPASPDKEAWSYKVIATAEKDGKIIAKAENMAPGFIKQEKVDKRMTTAQLQAMVNKRDPDLMGMGESKYVAPDLKLQFKGLNSEDIKPQIMQEVFDKLDFEVWKAVKVVGMKYDDMNRISEITFQVVH